MSSNIPRKAYLVTERLVGAADTIIYAHSRDEALEIAREHGKEFEWLTETQRTGAFKAKRAPGEDRP